MNKFCIISLARSGSQLCEELISRQLSQCIKLGEYFTSSDLPLAEQLEYIKSINQPVTIRWQFKPVALDQDSNKMIAGTLTELGYKFISLRRNYEHAALSSMIAKASEDSGNAIWGIDSTIINPIEIPVNMRYIFTPSYYYQSDRVWDTKINEILGIPYSTVNYESLYDDLGSMFNTVIEPIGQKTIQGNPWDYIINKEEVSKWFMGKDND